MTGDVDVVIVSFNAHDDLRACLRTLHASPPARLRSVIVIDNASRDGSPGLVREVLPLAQVVALPENVGFARANNIGIRMGTGRFVLLLNSDTEVPAGAIDAMASLLEAAAGAAALGPRLVDTTGHPERSFGRMISPTNELRQKLLGMASRNRGVLGRAALASTARAQDVDWVSGACLLVRREDAEAVGLLDERYFMYAEDVDFCAALRARGRRVVFRPIVEVVHKRGRSRAAAPEATRLAYRRSQLAFYAKHHPRWHPWLVRYLKVKGEYPE